MNDKPITWDSNRGRQALRILRLGPDPEATPTVRRLMCRDAALQYLLQIAAKYEHDVRIYRDRGETRRRWVIDMPCQDVSGCDYTFDGALIDVVLKFAEALRARPCAKDTT